MLQERWIDPDPSGSNLRAQNTGRWIGSEPTRSSVLYKRFITRFPSFFQLASLSSLFAVRILSKNPNPGSHNTTQKHMDRGLKASFRCSNHESTIEKRVHPLNRRRS